jgi:hypothetical protein
LKYIAEHTRPDLSFATNILAQNMLKPCQEHYNALTNCMRYLKGTSDKVLTFKKCNKTCIFAYADATRVPLGSCKDQTGYTIFINLLSATMCHKSISEKIITTSPCEAEIVAISRVIIELIWIKNISFPYNEPMIIYTDSLSAMDLLIFEAHKNSTKMKHIYHKIFFIVQNVENCNIKFVKINTKFNCSDSLTKQTSEERMLSHIELMLNGHNNQLPRLED